MKDLISEVRHEMRTYGTGFQDGKLRMMALAGRVSDNGELAKGLAKEYGVGGHSHTFLDGTRGFAEHDGKGIRFWSKAGGDSQVLSWAKAAVILRDLIAKGEYLTEDERQRYEAAYGQPAPEASSETAPDLSEQISLFDLMSEEA